MVFKSFYWKVGIRLLLLTAALSIFLYCLLEEFYLRSVYAGALVLFLLADLLIFFTRFVKNINYFLVSIQQKDFTLHLKESNNQKYLEELYQSINRLVLLFKQLHAENKIKQQYLEILVAHIRIGLISYDQQSKIHLVNDAFLELLNLKRLGSLQELEDIQKPFYEVLVTMHAGETRLFQFRKENQVLTLSMSAAEFKLGEQHFTLISVQDITYELNAREVEAWQKLIRVLTHEIMNSISPITSLSETLYQLVHAESSKQQWKEGDIHTLRAGLEAIQARSEGLQNFTQRYREFTTLPPLEIKPVEMIGFIHQVTRLFQADLEKNRITLHLDLAPVIKRMDRSQMQHVLVNLLKNAMDALQETQDPVIRITCYGQDGKMHLILSDNGNGIDEAILDKIFIPFFTTRKNGSGIGLALARQIVMAHRGEIVVQSQKSQGTEFRVVM